MEEEEAPNEISTYFDHLPEEIVYEIILRLPLKSIPRFKLASKHWNTLLSHDPHFMKALNNTRRRLLLSDHLLFYSYMFQELYTVGCTDLIRLETPPPPQFSRLEYYLYKDDLYNLSIKQRFHHVELSSYNGLVLLARREIPDYLDFVLWNPLTGHTMCVDTTIWFDFVEEYYPRMCIALVPDDYNYGIEYRKHDFFDEYRGKDCTIRLFGLCYNASRDEYSVFLAATYETNVIRFEFRDEYKHLRVFLINCKTGEVKVQDYKGLKNTRFRDFSGTVVCGAPHWLIELSEIYTNKDLPPKITGHEIVYFDPVKERLRRMAMPNTVGKGRNQVVGLGALRGQSQLSIVVNNVSESCYEVWIMKEYGVSDSWTKMFVVASDSVTKDIRYLDVLGYMPTTGELVLNVNRRELVVYDTRKESVIRSFEKVEAYWQKRKELFVAAYEPSLVEPPQAAANESQLIPADPLQSATSSNNYDLPAWTTEHDSGTSSYIELASWMAQG